LDRLLISCRELDAPFDLIVQQVALVPLQKDVSQRLQTAQAQYNAANASGDLRSIGALGKALEAVKAESVTISLTQKDYLTLADRHAQLVQRVVSKCQELAKAGKYAELSALASKLTTLRALDLAALPQLTVGKCW
jgi:archaeosine-15-forming tRNA-guanine transglycosylase